MCAWEEEKETKEKWDWGLYVCVLLIETNKPDKIDLKKREDRNRLGTTETASESLKVSVKSDKTLPLPFH